MSEPKYKHSLLQRQLRRYFSGSIPDLLQPFLQAVDQAYQDADTDRKMLERSLELTSLELLQRNQELMHLLNAVPDLSLRLNAKGHILSWYGQSKEVGFWQTLAEHTSFVAQLSPEQQSLLSSYLNTTISTRVPQVHSFILEHQSEKKIFELSFSPIFEADCLLVIRNLTQQISAQEALEKQNRQLMSYHLMSEVMLTAESLQETYSRIVHELVDLTGFESISIEHFEPESQQMILQASSLPDIETPQTIPITETLSGRCAQQGTLLVEQNIQEQPEYASLDLKTLEFSPCVCLPLLKQDRVIATLSLGSTQNKTISEDFLNWMKNLSQYLLTLIERKQFEITLFQSKQQAEAANEAKSRFLATMSHELRTPLNAIVGFSRVLTDKQAVQNQTQAQYLERIFSNGKHLLHLINDVLDISRIETGHYDIQLTDLHLQDTLRQIIYEFESLLLQKQLHWNLEMPSKTVRLQTDFGKLRQILNNLISNAIKFTPPGGHVTIRLILQHEHVVIQVEDTGIGIEASHQERIFEAFFQSESSYDRRYEGTGLGLAISKHLCEILGYQITLSSESGKGSCFSIALNPEIHTAH